jgi:hypothetical protein
MTLAGIREWRAENNNCNVQQPGLCKWVSQLQQGLLTLLIGSMVTIAKMAIHRSEPAAALSTAPHVIDAKTILNFR